MKKHPGINTHACVYQIVGIIPADDNCFVFTINKTKLNRAQTPMNEKDFFDVEISFK